MEDKTRGRYEEVIRSLNGAVYHLTWMGKFWGLGGALVLAEVRRWYMVRLGQKSDAYSSLSSTYYAAHGNAKAEAVFSILARPSWLFVSYLCRRRALHLSNRFTKLVGTLHNMSPAELDVRSTILRACGKYQAALDCIDEALVRPSACLIPDTRALLLAGAGDAYYHLRNAKSAEAFEQALSVENVSPKTRVRILKTVTSMNRRAGLLGAVDRQLKEARAIAEREGLNDQVLKINALFYS